MAHCDHRFTVHVGSDHQKHAVSSQEGRTGHASTNGDSWVASPTAALRTAEDTWDEFNKTDPDQSAAFMRSLDAIPGVQRINPIPNHEIVHKPGDVVQMEHARGSLGTVLKHYPPGTARTEGYYDMMNMIDRDDPEYGGATDDHSYDVQWHLSPELLAAGYKPEDHIGQMVEGHRLWPEGDVRLQMALSKTSAVPMDQAVYIAEGAMERAGLIGERLSNPHGHRNHPSPEGVAAAAKMTELAQQITGVPLVHVVITDDPVWGAGADVRAAYDPIYHSISIRPESDMLTFLHECAHAINNTAEGQGHDAAFCRTAHGLYAKYISEEAADVFWNLIGPYVGRSASRIETAERHGPDPQIDITSPEWDDLHVASLHTSEDEGWQPDTWQPFQELPSGYRKWLYHYPSQTFHMWDTGSMGRLQGEEETHHHPMARSMGFDPTDCTTGDVSIFKDGPKVQAFGMPPGEEWSSPQEYLKMINQRVNKQLLRERLSADAVTDAMLNAAPSAPEETRTPNRYVQPDSVLDNARYFHSCPMCKGYLRDRGGVHTCDNCGFEPEPEQRTSSADEQGHNGYTNYETWLTKLMMDNEQHLAEKQQEMGAQQWTPEQVRDWTIQHVVGPHNVSQIADAQEWNSIPEHDRLDHNWEGLREKNPELAESMKGLFGPDVGDTTPNTIDHNLVNWDEIHQHIMDDHEEERRHREGLPPTWQDPTPDPDKPGDFTLPEGWTAKTSADDWQPFEQAPEGQWFKWGYNPQHGAMTWPVTGGSDGDAEDMRNGRTHIDMLNSTWKRTHPDGTTRYPFFEGDRTGVIYHDPQSNTAYVTQYPRGGTDLAYDAWPDLEQQMRAHLPQGFEMNWPTEVQYKARVGNSGDKVISAASSFKWREVRPRGRTLNEQAGWGEIPDDDEWAGRTSAAPQVMYHCADTPQDTPVSSQEAPGGHETGWQESQ